MTELKTPFMWPGSKDKNWTDIKKFIPDNFDNYAEPFLGGGSVYFRLLNRESVKNVTCHIAEINDGLRNSYKIIKLNPNYIVENLPVKKDKTIFTKWYKETTSTISDEESAMRFIYLNRNRFFGLGGWMCADRYARKKVIERITFFSPRMSNTKIYNDAFSIPLTESTFVFCDPPYPETDNASCYKVDNTKILDLNLNYLKRVIDSNCQYLFITKNVKEVNQLVNDLKCSHEVKRWSYRKPGKDPQISEEIWIYKNNNHSFFIN